ncbi:MAG: metal-dependent hydrolase [Candidatus Thermoplasmatota archaeon]
MDPIWHFVISAAMGLFIVREWKRPLLWVGVIGAMGVLPDLDHLLSARYLHSIYLLAVAPLLTFVASYIAENAACRAPWGQRMSLLCLAILPGHLVLDLVAGNTLPLLWPEQSTGFVLRRETWWSLGGSNIFTMGSAVMSIWMLDVVGCMMLESAVRRRWEEISGEWNPLLVQHGVELPIFLRLDKRIKGLPDILSSNLGTPHSADNAHTPSL